MAQAPGGYPALQNQGQTSEGPQAWGKPIQQPLGPPGGYPPLPQPPPANSKAQAKKPIKAHVLTCPPDMKGTRYPAEGLGFLNHLDTIVVKEKVDLVEVLTRIDRRNRYKVMDKHDQLILYAKEESALADRQCCQGGHSLCLDFLDYKGSALIRMTREFKAGYACLSCARCCGKYPSCAQEFVVQSPPGFHIGSIRQEAISCSDCCWIFDAFTVFDEYDSPIARGTVPTPHCRDGSFDIQMLLISNPDFEIARIKKMWAGLAQEMLTDADNYSVHFSLDLNPKMKILMIATIFYIDYVNFDFNPPPNRRNRRLYANNN